MARLAVIMAGGAGERFWPLSRPDRPKQLLPFGAGEKTLLEDAVERAAPLFGERMYISTGQAAAEPILSSKIVPPDRVFVEPTKRNTLGALVWTAANLIAKGLDDATLAVLAADHHIGDPEKFRRTVAIAMDAAEKTGGLATLGIRPTRPETGYGYIEAGDPLAWPEGAFAVRQFREKPGIEQARAFLEAGRFYWNSGMFFWTLAAFLRELSAAQPEAHAACRQIAEALASGDEGRANTLFQGLPNVSVDYALLEKAKGVVVVPADFPWDDLGAWDALARAFPSDDRCNTVLGEALLIETEGSIVFNEGGGRILALLGVADLIVVATDDAMLVCPKDRAQDVRRIVEELRRKRLPQV